jgi:hypothetical protein
VSRIERALRIGAVFAPIAAYVLAHYVAPSHPRAWFVVIAALVLCLPEAAAWFGSWIGDEIAGIEGAIACGVIVVFPYRSHPWTEVTAVLGLVVLVLINGVATWRKVVATRRASAP